MTVSVSAINSTETIKPQTPQTKVNFAGKNYKELEKDTLELENKKTADIEDDEEEIKYGKASTGKKIGVAAGSLWIPGLGQAINGQWAKAGAFFAGAVGMAIAKVKLIRKHGYGEELFKNKTYKMLKWAGLALLIVAAVDAWRNARSKVE